MRGFGILDRLRERRRIIRAHPLLPQPQILPPTRKLGGRREALAVHNGAPALAGRKRALVELARLLVPGLERLLLARELALDLARRELGAVELGLERANRVRDERLVPERAELRDGRGVRLRERLAVRGVQVDCEADRAGGKLRQPSARKYGSVGARTLLAPDSYRAGSGVPIPCPEQHARPRPCRPPRACARGTLQTDGRGRTAGARRPRGNTPEEDVVLTFWAESAGQAAVQACRRMAEMQACVAAAAVVGGRVQRGTMLVLA